MMYTGHLEKYVNNVEGFPIVQSEALLKKKKHNPITAQGVQKRIVKGEKNSTQIIAFLLLLDL